MLDVLSHGRLDFGVGRGSADYEYGNFNVDFDTRDGRTQEALDIILGLWTEDDFTFQGEFYEVKDLTIAPRPVQQPHPPVYLAVSRTPASVDVAVSRDLPILTSFSTPEADNLGLFFPVRRTLRRRRQGPDRGRDALLPIRASGRGRAHGSGIPSRGPSGGCATWPPTGAR